MYLFHVVLAIQLIFIPCLDSAVCNVLLPQALSDTLSDLGDVGHLTVRVIRAEGISPEYVWKRNPFTVLQVGNSRVQTKEHMGTVTPHWNKTFKL